MLLLQLSNNLVCQGELSPQLLTTLVDAQDQFRFQVLSMDVFESLFHVASGDPGAVDGDAGGGVTCNLRVFEEMLGSVLSLAATTFIELPSLEVLERALEMFSPDCSLYVLDRYAGLPGGGYTSDIAAFELMLSAALEAVGRETQS